MTDPELLARRKKRYAEDEEYRERLLAGNRARHHRNKDKINARKRHRWATDPEYRANLLARVNKETRRKTQQVQQQSKSSHAKIPAQRRASSRQIKSVASALAALARSLPESPPARRGSTRTARAAASGAKRRSTARRAWPRPPR
jgi:hypothetical protein